MSSQRRPMHALSVLHVVLMAGLLMWWAIYFWKHTPSRELLGPTGPTTSEFRRAPTSNRTAIDRAAGEFGRRARDAAAALAVAAADLAAGTLVFILFAIGTGIYVRRFEIWLQARASGEVVAFAGSGLDDEALAANKSPLDRRP